MAVQAPVTYSSEVLATKIKNQDVIRLALKPNDMPNDRPKVPKIVAVEVAKGAGLGVVAWMVRLPDGRVFNLTGAVPPSTISETYEKDAKNPYRDNLFFQAGIVATLFPMTNRLLGRTATKGFITAEVLGETVRMPLNNTAKTPGAIPHQLHGLIYGQTAENVKVHVTPDAAQVTGDFKIGPDLWTGHTKVTTTNELSASGYSFHLKAKNVGTTPVPVAAGAHPYFASPDPETDSIRIFVPAEKTAEINNLSDVLPTGHIISLKNADPSLNFTDPNGTNLFASEVKNNPTRSRLDHLWLDLKKDAQGFAFCEVFFPRSHFKVRMTAMTKNVIGIQGYAPKFTTEAKPFVALEFVTNLPDPRRELWGDTPTGMILLKPGEEFDYGYRIEVKPL